MTVAIHAGTALLPDGFAKDVRLTLEGGRIAAVETGVAARPGDHRAKLLLPGMSNVHSHAFQRAMAGLAEIRGPATDTFWTWREVMYHHALTLDPDQMETVAAWLYLEMVEAGFTRVGEFHYLHHDRDGRPYADIGEMAGRIGAAAAETGIGLTLLPVLYAHATFGGVAPQPRQRRFICGRDQFAALMDASEAVVRGLPGANIGVAPHSLRAVTPDELAFAAALRPERPLHMHISEQVKEVEDCLAWCGKRPVEWLLDAMPVDARWCLVHATHLTPAETQRLAASGAAAGLCPVTEANLGDGTFNGPAYLAAGGRFGVGTDSNVLIGVADELRQLEYAQRLFHRERNVMAAAGGSVGRRLFGEALSGGAQALGVSEPRLAPDAPADLVALDTDHPGLVGRAGDQLLDAFIFTGAKAIDAVWIAGRQLVADGRHIARDRLAPRFAAVMRDLAAA